MGNHNSTTDTSFINNESIFKVDNINSYGRKHSTAKIQLLNDNLCIHQKHRQSLFIPLNTIKRYGLDGSIFILECGRRAPLGSARYAFRCKQARHLVDCLDERISVISNKLLNEQQDKSLSSLTTVSSAFNNLRRTQSSISLSSDTSFYRNSQTNLSENYFIFEKGNQQYPNSINYAEFQTQREKSQSSLELPITFEMHQSNVTLSNSQNDDTIAATLVPSTSKSYVLIDHEKTTTLKEITKQRLQQHPVRHDT
ncbi:unnamed protein product [Rotaria sp. Silwood1]|nr:unnamed protein product [Rotaria sp. Silwood1]CAF0990583.1 unnamed protein product [Rotaria sp. Silwood1]CAF0999529.1 unnamed protein product [Rotaria sp. Silwood1]CAF3385853.1 unnamed protein product [Rotaria sp. Silwood1]CAF3407585.1 unnamed protein product [Rotaria sp. Silwood1]